MKLSTWLLNRKLYFHMKRQLQKSPAFKMNPQPLRILRTPTVSNGMMIKKMAR